MTETPEAEKTGRRRAAGKARPAQSAAQISPAGVDQTRQALVRAALRLFGAAGYDGASTRQIAAAANSNIGSIAYHFGGKEGLRLAVADHIVSVVEDVAGRVDLAEAPSGPMTAEEAEKMLIAMLERMFTFFVASDEAADIVPFVLREMSQPSAAFERVYSGLFEPMHRRFCAVWEVATGEPAESEETRIAIFTLIGQVVYFRLAGEAVKRRMGWAGLGQPEVDRVSRVMRQNLHAAIAARKAT